MLEKDMNHEYLGITGDVSFNKLAPEFLFGENSAPLQEGRVAVSQVLSGTGGLRVAFEFIKRFGNSRLPPCSETPTWGNHHDIIRDARLKETKHRYYDPATNGLDFAGMCENTHTAPNGSVVLSLTRAPIIQPESTHHCEQWKGVSSIMKGKEMLPFFDSAYQGFASGDSEQDAAAVRHFVDEGHCVITTQSFSKNFGLYNDRVGALSVVCADEEEKKRVEQPAPNSLSGPCTQSSSSRSPYRQPYSL